VLFITHSIDEAIVLSDRALVMTARPGTLKADIEVRIPRPRKVYELKATSEYGALSSRLWSELRAEVLAAKSEGGGTKPALAPELRASEEEAL
jgi:NitT/TauT family transport system ATP-binding protein